jgi:peptide chain release factor subunit 1
MLVNEITPDRLRQLAGLRLDHGKVLSVYLDLDPSVFGTVPARASEMRSIIDEAGRRVREADGLSHDEAVALRDDVARLEQFFDGEVPTEAAHGVAVFSASAAGLFEALRLPRPTDRQIVIDSSPFIEPLARVGTADGWAVLIVDRQLGRILRGSADDLHEVEDVKDDVPPRQKQGGWSQARFQRHSDEHANEHVKRACEALLDEFKRRPFERLLVVADEQTWPVVEHELHPYLQRRLARRLSRDLEHETLAEVAEVIRPLLQEDEREHERELLDRLHDRLGMRERGAAGLDDVLAALVERRVESLLLADRFTASGVACPRCGWMAAAGESCPVDGGPLERRDDIVENAVESAVLQSADVVFVRHHDDLGPLGGIGAVLRF